MSLLFDSGWVPSSIGVAKGSGTVKGVVPLGDATRVRITYAASGSSGVNNNATAPYLSWSAGSTSPVPWSKNTPAYPMTPLITGVYTVTGTILAGTAVSYYLGSNMSGASHLDDWVPDTVYVGVTQGSASYARIIVEAR